MAFNLATFKTRALTAIVFVLVMVGGLIWNQWSFFILFSIIHFGCWVEYQKLVRLIDKEYVISDFHRYGVMIAGWCFMWFFTNDAVFGISGIRLSAIGWWLGLVFVLVLPLIELLFTKNFRLKNIAHSAFGLLYISLPFGLLVDLTMPTNTVQSDIYHPAVWGPSMWAFPAFIIGCMWVNDTMAYIVGSLIGRTPFSKISPKKTWEGTIGGIILCALVMGHLGYKLINDYVGVSVVHWSIMAGIAAITGTGGDLLESKLKRLAGVKDSGHIMPGHGGFLDRFDSLLVAVPFVWLYLRVLLWT